MRPELELLLAIAGRIIELRQALRHLEQDFNGELGAMLSPDYAAARLLWEHDGWVLGVLSR